MGKIHHNIYLFEYYEQIQNSKQIHQKFEWETRWEKLSPRKGSKTSKVLKRSFYGNYARFRSANKNSKGLKGIFLTDKI